MSVTGADALLGIVKQKQDLQGYRERHWTGTLEDYMEIVMANPKVARNAYQRPCRLFQANRRSAKRL